MPRGRGPVNKSGKPVNSTNDFSALMRRVQSTRIPGPAETRLTGKLGDIQNEMQYALERGTDTGQTQADYYAEIADIQGDINRYEGLISKEREARQARYEKEFTRKITAYA